MNVIVCHNYYRERGGEDQVFENEVELLRSGGVQVTTMVRHNADLTSGKLPGTALGTPWNVAAYRELRRLVAETGAEIVHVHNWVPQLSPAVFYAARRAGAAVVHTLHNYRWACPKGTLFRDGAVCEDCFGRRLPWPAVRHACYRDRRSASGVLAGSLALHHALGTPVRAIDAYVAAGSFVKEKMVAAGLPADRIHLRPNFVTRDPGAGPGRGGYAMFLGRLSPEKGLDVLLEAWRRLPEPIPLKISGKGPLRPLVEAAAAELPAVEYLGFVPDDELDDLLGDAALLVFTSITYEVQPITIIEAFAKGTPVVGPDHGATTELVVDGVTGWRFRPGDPEALARRVADAFADPARLADLRPKVRAYFEDRFLPVGSLEQLLRIYAAAKERRREGVRR